MIDIHCHVLPGIDDGSRSVEMSLAMLHELKRQGVDKVIATPHFYPTRNSPEKYLADRQSAYERLIEAVDDGCPEIVLGAEVMYFEGISRYEGLNEFKTKGTDILLLEMPFISWTSRAIDEVIRLSASYKTTLVMAHIERYFKYVDRKVWKIFSENGILMQSNAEALMDRKLRRKILRKIKDGTVSFIATDSHNMSGRAPNMEDALNEIRKSLGEEAVGRIVTLTERYYGLAGDNN